MPIRVLEQRTFNPSGVDAAAAASSASAGGAALDSSVGLGVLAAVAAGTGAAVQPANVLPVESAVAVGFNLSPSIFEWFGGAAPGTTAVPETGAQLVSRLKSTFGFSTMPIMKAFPNNVPTAWSTAWDVCDGNRVILCMRPNVSFANAAAGGDDGEFTSFCNSVPTGKYVRVVLDNEPEQRLAAGNYTVADFHETHRRFKVIADAATAASGGAKRIEIWTCFQVPFQTGYSTTATTGNSYRVWLPPPDKCHGLGWDCYFNKFGVPGPTGATGDLSSYEPNIQGRFSSALAVTQLLGHTRLGVMEYSGPPRIWDDGSWPAAPWYSDAQLKGRWRYIRDGFDYLQAIPGMECIVLFDSFNKNNGSQDQRFIAGSRPPNGSGASSGSPFPAFSHMSVSPYPVNEPVSIEITARIVAGPHTAWPGGSEL